MNSDQLKAMLANPDTRPQALDIFGQWVKSTCLLFGCEPSNAYRIAFVFVEGVEASYEGRKPKPRIVR